mmetsp:Transcript_49157/g.111297  ORF Transcript_49157/g.111297 Transcript_49157/m.111297 type:complete len:81 (+) Transcript_49157:181-423(+)
MHESFQKGCIIDLNGTWELRRELRSTEGNTLPARNPLAWTVLVTQVGRILFIFGFVVCVVVALVRCWVSSLLAIIHNQQI